MVTGSLGLATSIFCQMAAAAALRSGRAWWCRAGRGAPVSQGVGVIGLGLVEGLILPRPRRISGPWRAGRSERAAGRAGGGELDGLVEPGLGLGGASHAGEGASQPDEGFDVVGLFLGPLFVVGDEPGWSSFRRKTSSILRRTSRWSQLSGRSLPSMASKSWRASSVRPRRTFRSAACMASWTWRKGSVALLARASKRGRAAAGWFSSARAGRSAPGRGVVGEEGFEAVPDLQGLVVFLGALVDAAQGLEDVEEVVAGGLASEGAFEGLGGLFGLADQDEGLAEVKRGQGVVGAGGFGLLEGGDGGGVLAALEFEEAEDQPGGAVVGILGEAVAVGLDEGVERAAFDVVAVDAVERRAPARVFFEEREEPLHRAPLARLFGGGGVGGPWGLPVPTGTANIMIPKPRSDEPIPDARTWFRPRLSVCQSSVVSCSLRSSRMRSVARARCRSGRMRV